MTPQNSRKTDWVWLTCVAALVAAMAWTGTSLTAIGPELQASGNQAPAPRPSAPSASDQDRRQSSPTPFSAFDWWNDAEIKKEIGLSDEKAKRIQDYFESRNKQMQPWVEDWRRERARLDKMTQERVSDESSYGIQVWRVEQLSAKLRETRAMMAYRMYMQLSPEQYRKLRDWIDRRFNNGRGRGGSSPR